MNYHMQSIRALGRDFDFLLNSEIDHIQNIIRSGKFYEVEELELIAEYAPSPKRILDVGANIGNHTIYFAHRFNPDLTVPVEPNPLVIPLLRANAGLNWHRSFDLSLVGYGFSDQSTTGVCRTLSPENLGGAKLELCEKGPIPIIAADVALPGMEFDLIKIDVEGMESEVVSGMSKILARSRAVVFIEVLFKNVDSIMTQLNSLGYAYRTSHQRYGRCINLLFERIE
jgi:FkbM family methyltransferase